MDSFFDIENLVLEARHGILEQKQGELVLPFQALFELLETAFTEVDSYEAFVVWLARFFSLEERDIVESEDWVYEHFHGSQIQEVLRQRGFPESRRNSTANKILVVVLGPSGAGKSTLCRALIRNSQTGAAIPGLRPAVCRSGTRFPRVYAHPSMRYMVMDTPGCDDASLERRFPWELVLRVSPVCVIVTDLGKTDVHKTLLDCTLTGTRSTKILTCFNQVDKLNETKDETERRRGGFWDFALREAGDCPRWLTTFTSNTIGLATAVHVKEWLEAAF